MYNFESFKIIQIIAVRKSYIGVDMCQNQNSHDQSCGPTKLIRRVSIMCPKAYIDHGWRPGGPYRLKCYKVKEQFRY